MAVYKCNSCGATADTDATSRALGYGAGTKISFILSKCGNCGSSNISEVNRGSSNQSKDSSCFIATAVYGSNSEPQVLTLRNWRDTYLFPFRGGRVLIHFYYFVGPFLAKLIKMGWLPRHPVRLMLDFFVRIYISPLTKKDGEGNRDRRE